MMGGSALVSPDCTPPFGNLQLYRDEAVPYLRALSDDVHEQGRSPHITPAALRKSGWPSLVLVQTGTDPGARAKSAQHGECGTPGREQR
jgi:hypothetical protein